MLLGAQHRKNGRALCLLYKIYDRMNHRLREYLHHFVAARNTRAPTALGELSLAIPRCRTDQFSLSFLHDFVRLLNLLQSSVFSEGSLSSFNPNNLAFLRIFTKQ